MLVLALVLVLDLVRVLSSENPPTRREYILPYVNYDGPYDVSLLVVALSMFIA